MVNSPQSIRLDETALRQLRVIKAITGMNASEAIREAIRVKSRDISLAFAEHEISYLEDFTARHPEFTEEAQKTLEDLRAMVSKHS